MLVDVQVTVGGEAQVEPAVAPKWPTPGRTMADASARPSAPAGSNTSAPHARSALRTDARLPAP